jgi:hypothetical protein
MEVEEITYCRRHICRLFALILTLSCTTRTLRRKIEARQIAHMESCVVPTNVSGLSCGRCPVAEMVALTCMRRIVQRSRLVQDREEGKRGQVRGVFGE